MAFGIVATAGGADPRSIAAFQLITKSAVAAKGIGVSLSDACLDDALKALTQLSAFTPTDLARIEENVPGHLLQRFWAKRNAQSISGVPGIASLLAASCNKRFAAK